jgi:hypothetical protein
MARICIQISACLAVPETIGMNSSSASVFSLFCCHPEQDLTMAKANKQSGSGRKQDRARVTGQH